MRNPLTLSRPRAVLAAGTAALTIGGVGLAWASVGAPAAEPASLAASREVAGDVSGPCDEAEHAADPRCAGAATATTATTGATTTSTAPTTVPAPGAPGAPAAPAPAPGGAEVRSFPAAGAGTVTYTVAGGSLQLVDARPAAGWRVEVERGSGPELDLDFRSGTQRVQVDVEFEDGTVRERVRVRDDADGTRTEAIGGTAAPTVGTVAPTVGDDDGTADRGSGDPDDDRSGRGGDDVGIDDRGGDDDRSGRGGDD